MDGKYTLRWCCPWEKMYNYGTESTREFITLKKSLKNDYSDTVCGIIEVRASVDRLEQMLYTEDNAEILICDRSNGKIIYPTVYTERERSEYSSAFVNNANWEIMIRTPVANTKTNIIFILSLFVVLYAILLMFVFLISRTIGKEVIKPISQLANHVCKIDAPDDKMAHINDDAIDEIKELEDSFEKMLERMNNSIIQEKKAYALALQAQMNPHFLYNTLDSIQWMCEQGKNEDAVRMISALARLFRISISRGHELIPIEKEVEHARSYLKIQKFRYKDQFEYEFQVDESCLGYYCNKITLQPIIENAIYHGIDRMVDQGFITIRIFPDGEDIVFQVEDNGIGMTEEQCSQFLKQEGSDRQGLGGIGIKNVNDRIKIYFGEKYGISKTGNLQD